MQCKVTKKVINRKGETMKKARGIFSKVVKLISDDNMQILPGQLAFFIILSFFSIIPLIGLITSSFISIDLIKGLENSLPAGVYQILVALLDVKSSGSIIIFVAVALYFSSDGANALIITSNVIYKIPNNHFLKRKIKAMVMTILLIFLIIFVVVIPAFGDIIINLIKNNTSGILINHIDNIYNYLKIPLSFILIFLIIKILYTIAPDKKIPSFYNNYGTLFTTISWIVVTRIYSWYLSLYNTYNLFYGSFANVVILFFWMYILSFVLTLGMAINSAYYERCQTMSK